MAGKGLLAVPADRKKDVGNVERVVYTQAGGKEELLRNTLRNNTVERCVELGGGVR